MQAESSFERVDRWMPTLIIAAAVALVVALVVIFAFTPNEASMGFAQKIFYFHLPAAILGYAGFIICCTASILYLRRPSGRVDAVARTGAAVGLLFFGMVLVSGPFWGNKIWGAYWTGEPRLTLALALFVIYLSYVLVRSYGGDTPLVRRIGAVLAIFGFADIPLVRMAVEKWGGNHPSVMSEGGISSEMTAALVCSFVAFILLFAVFFIVRLRLALLEESVDDLHLAVGDRVMLLESTH